MSNSVIAIDPGSEGSGVVFIYKGVPRLKFFDKNEEVIDYLRFTRQSNLLADTTGPLPPLVIEMIASYGMAVGKSVFETCVWIGRFTEAYGSTRTSYLYRPDIKLHLCRDSRAKDSNVRQAIMDRYGSTREKAIGTKKNKGPLYGVSNHLWSAMAVGLTWLDANKETATE